MNPLLLLSDDEHMLRLGRVTSQMRANGIDAIIISDYANIYYLTGRVYTGHMAILADGSTRHFVRRPLGLGGPDVEYVRKPEEMSRWHPLAYAHTIGLELDLSSYSSIERLKLILPDATIANASPLLKQARAVKTPAEIDLIRRSGIRHTHVYSHIPRMLRAGMTDLELQVEIERMSRLEGCLGEFRISGDSMEIYMGSVLAGRNADVPTPYDFAMGGAGIDPSLPVGADGTTILEGNTVMVDMNGNFTGYMTDMTRVFCLGQCPDKAAKAHRCSIEICRRFEKMARPGVKCSDIYEMALATAHEAELADYFMGHNQKAAFVGHGVGIEINELPVIAPRSRQVLEAGNVVALEPKFVLPGIGAVGIENTYVIGNDSVENLTTAPEEITIIS